MSRKYLVNKIYITYYIGYRAIEKEKTRFRVIQKSLPEVDFCNGHIVYRLSNFWVSYNLQRIDQN